MTVTRPNEVVLIGLETLLPSMTVVRRSAAAALAAVGAPAGDDAVGELLRRAVGHWEASSLSTLPQALGLSPWDALSVDLDHEETLRRMAAPSRLAIDVWLQVLTELTDRRPIQGAAEYAAQQLIAVRESLTRLSPGDRGLLERITTQGNQVWLFHDGCGPLTRRLMRVAGLGAHVTLSWISGEVGYLRKDRGFAELIAAEARETGLQVAAVICGSDSAVSDRALATHGGWPVVRPSQPSDAKNLAGVDRVAGYELLRR